MRQTVQTMTLILLAGAMLAGCGDYKLWPPPDIPDILGIFGGDKKAEEENAKPIDLEGLVKDPSKVTETTTAVDIGKKAVKKRDDTMDKLEEEREKNWLLREKDKSSQEQIGTLKVKLAGTEKELAEANEMLKEMQVELAKWKENVLGFRGEMRQSQKALLEGVARLHVLISGGVAMESPTTQPAPIASNTKR